MRSFETVLGMAIPSKSNARLAQYNCTASEDRCSAEYADQFVVMNGTNDIDMQGTVDADAFT